MDKGTVRIGHSRSVKLDGDSPLVSSICRVTVGSLPTLESLYTHRTCKAMQVTGIESKLQACGTITNFTVQCIPALAVNLTVKVRLIGGTSRGGCLW